MTPNANNELNHAGHTILNVFTVSELKETEPNKINVQLRMNANGRLPFYEAKVLFSEGRGRM